jgi:rSAM/selenodomain-associated transferase 2
LASRTRPDLSIVIPVYREPDRIGPLLLHLAGCPGIDRCEIVVVDGDEGSSRTPTEILPLMVVESPPGRSTQLNRGARVTRAALLLFLHVDTRPPRTFIGRVIAALSEVRAGAFDLTIDSSSMVVRLIGLAGRLRSRITRIPYGDQVHFIRRDAFEELGGYPSVPIMEDVALMDRVKARRWPIVILRPPAHTSGRRWEVEGGIRTTLRNWRLLTAYRAGVSPHRLAKSYLPHSELTGRAHFPWRIEADRDWDTSVDDSRILLFHRSMRPTGVKTRLATTLGRKAALELYQAMVLDIAEEANASGIKVMPFVDSDEGETILAGSRLQRGEGLFERMAGAFDEAFSAGARRAILIGSDIPEISAALLREAVSLLGRFDSVIGPTHDAGYYLIGFRRNTYERGAFEVGAEETEPFDPTVRYLRSRGRKVAKLPGLIDVDTEEDLRDALAARGSGMRNLRRTAHTIMPT